MMSLILEMNIPNKNEILSLSSLWSTSGDLYIPYKHETYQCTKACKNTKLQNKINNTLIQTHKYDNKEKSSKN